MKTELKNNTIRIYGGNFVSRIDQVVDMKYWDLKIK